MALSARALAVSTAALQTIGNNIANANTPGYSRQTAIIQSAGAQYTGQGFFGNGANVTTVQRAHSDYLSHEATLTQAVQAADEARSKQVQQMEQVFPTGSDGLGTGISNVLNAFAAVGSAPKDLSARTAALSQVDELTARFRSAQGSLDSLQQGTTSQIQDGVAAVNQIASSLAAVNQQIIRQSQPGHSPNDLLDQRDQLISDINQWVQTSSVPASNGSVSVFVNGGQALVLGGQANRLSLTPDRFDASIPRLALTASGHTTALNEATLGGGSLAGLLQFQNVDLAQGRDLLGRMGLTLSDQLNTQHRLGVDLNQQTGKDLISISALPDALPSSANTGSATLGVSLTDSTALQASDYELQINGGQIDVVRQSDGLTRSFSTWPIALDGLSVSLSSGATASADRFWLRPLHSVAAQMQTAVTSASGLAAASPVMATPSASNSAGLVVSRVGAVQPDANLLQPVSLSFTSSGSFNVSGVGTGNPSGQIYTAGQTIAFNGWQLVLSGQPSAGDVFTVKANTGAAADGSNAQSLLALRDKPAFDGASISNGYANLLTQVGSRVQGAQSAASVSASIAAHAEQARASVAGVNLDEEAAKLLQYQQSYQAAAKVLQIAQSVFASLLQSVSA